MLAVTLTISYVARCCLKSSNPEGSSRNDEEGGQSSDDGGDGSDIAGDEDVNSLLLTPFYRTNRSDTGNAAAAGKSVAEAGTHRLRHDALDSFRMAPSNGTYVQSRNGRGSFSRRNSSERAVEKLRMGDSNTTAAAPERGGGDAISCRDGVHDDTGIFCYEGHNRSSSSSRRLSSQRAVSAETTVDSYDQLQPV